MPGGRSSHPPYLPAQVPEADVELMLLAGLPLVRAAVFCMDEEGEARRGERNGEHTQTEVSSVCGRAVSTIELRRRQGGRSDTAPSRTRSLTTRFRPQRRVMPTSRPSLTQCWLTGHAGSFCGHQFL